MTTLATLQDILIAEFEVPREQLVPEAELAALGVDSLDLLELMFKIEDRYKLSIRDDVPTDLVTIADVVAYIDGLLARQSKARGVDPPNLRSTT
ncbi:MAG: phosphopantetheine-binding protein [Steroidobacteraceae bacterium]|jgi:acyl carrier protein